MIAATATTRSKFCLHTLTGLYISQGDYSIFHAVFPSVGYLISSSPKTELVYQLPRRHNGHESVC